MSSFGRERFLVTLGIGSVAADAKDTPHSPLPSTYRRRNGDGGGSDDRERERERAR